MNKQVDYFLKTWQGQSEWYSLNTVTHVASQLVSSLQSRMHWPKVLLFFDKQASRLSSLVASWKIACFLVIFHSFDLHCRSKLHSRSYCSLRDSPCDMDMLNSMLRYFKCIIHVLGIAIYKYYWNKVLTYNHCKQLSLDCNPKRNCYHCKLQYIWGIHHRIAKYKPSSDHNRWIRKIDVFNEV